MNAPFLCDCGHMSTPDGMAAGYAVDEQNKTLCYGCAWQAQLADARATGQTMGYLTLNGNRRMVTTWTGEPLFVVTRATTRTMYGAAGEHERTYVRAFDPQTGERWYGQGPGEGMYVRMRRSKARK